MSERETRAFACRPAVRGGVPLWLGIYGPSGSGKTYSALRMARGIQSVTGGKIAVGDTESGRALHYADEFDFLHYPFDPPFDPLSYRDLIAQMAADGVSIAIIDSASHEHEGPGGVLEMHDAETELLASKWKLPRDKAQASGWIRPKRERLQMIDGAKRTKLHLIWCFRAQNKMDFTAKKPTPRGFMPIGGEVLVYEMAMTALLLPGAKGKPEWQPEESGEKEMVKLPHWARKMLREEGHPLDEDLGAALARWASGDEVARAELRSLYDRLSAERRERMSKAISSREAIDTLEAARLPRAIEVLRRAIAEQEEQDR